MKLLIISGSLHFEHSFMFNLVEALKKELHEITIIRIEHIKIRELVDIDNNIYLYDYCIKQKRIPLSHLIKNPKNFEAIIIENTQPYLLSNDLGDDSPPVIFYHRDYLAPLFVSDPDILLYRFNKTSMNNIKRLFSDQYYSEKIKKKLLFFHAINPDDFEYKKEKSYRGITFPGFPKSIDFYMSINQFHDQYYYVLNLILKQIRKYGLVDNYFGVTSFREYKKLVSKSEFILTLFPFNAFETRRLYEAAYCGSIPVLFIQNDIAEETLNIMGFIENENCVFFRDLEDLDDFNRENYNIKLMSEKAHKLIMDNFTYEKRAQELIKIIENKDIIEDDLFEIKPNQEDIYKKYYFPVITDKNMTLEKVRYLLEKNKLSYFKHKNLTYIMLYERIIKFLKKKQEELL